MNKETAIKIQKRALESIAQLMEILGISDENCTPEIHEQIKRGVGLSLGTIQMEILEIVNHAYPELDDLN